MRVDAMPEKEITGREEPKKKLGLTSWLKVKLLGKDQEVSHVDQQFLDDLSDIKAVGRYEIVGKLGQGSMGVVYLGRDPYINRYVSIKISRAGSDAGVDRAEKYRERFFVEAQSAGKLLHPNIVAIYDAGMYKDFCYITMEYIDGPTLEKFCRRESLLPASRAVEIIFSACKALDFAHKKGVIHRDVKPSNIMINKGGVVKITDFGIAQVRSEQANSEGIIGSPSYMSPEQVKEEPIEDKSDIFSLGCVLYELLTGERAFSGDNYFSIMYKIVNENPVPIKKMRPDLPEILWKITWKALAKNPGHRYQSCMDLAYDLRVSLRGLKGGVAGDKVESVVDYMQSVPFFDNFTKEQVREILEASHIIKVRKGQVVVAEGEIDDTFFIILSGNAAVQKHNANIALISRGECFGEMSYLGGQSRAATVVAQTDCILLKISATLLDRSAEPIQLLFMKNFATTLMKRLSKAIQ